MDPLAELLRRFRPYTYGNNNPVRFIDPDGMMTTDADGGIHSDSVEEAQAMFRQLQSQSSSQDQDDPKKKKKEDPFDPETRIKNAPNVKKLNSWWQKGLSFLNGGRDYNGIHYGDDGNPIGISLIKMEFPFYISGPGDVIKGAQALEGITVLGKYPEYIKLSEQLGANRFSIPAKIWNKMSSVEQWEANAKFLERAVARGDQFILSNPVKDVSKATGYFRKELEYLVNKGYRLIDNGTKLIKK